MSSPRLVNKFAKDVYEPNAKDPFQRQIGPNFNISELTKRYAHKSIKHWGALLPKSAWIKEAPKEHAWISVDNLETTLNQQLFKERNEDFCINLEHPDLYFADFKKANQRMAALGEENLLTDDEIYAQAVRFVSDDSSGRTRTGVKLGNLFITYQPGGKGSANVQVYILDLDKEHQTKKLLFNFANSRYSALEFEDVIPFSLSSFYPSRTYVGHPKELHDKRERLKEKGGKVKKLLALLALGEKVDLEESKEFISDFLSEFNDTSSAEQEKSVRAKQKPLTSTEVQAAKKIALRLERIYYQELGLTKEDVMAALDDFKRAIDFNDNFLNALLDTRLGDERLALKSILCTDDALREVPPLAFLKEAVSALSKQKTSTSSLAKRSSTDLIQKTERLAKTSSPTARRLSSNKTTYKIEDLDYLYALKRTGDTRINEKLDVLQRAINNEPGKEKRTKIISETNNLTEQYNTALEIKDAAEKETALKKLQKDLGTYQSNLQKLGVGQKILIAAFAVVGAVAGAIGGFFLGAAIGGTVGSVVPGFGTAIGAGVGGVLNFIAGAGVGAQVGAGVGAGVAVSVTSLLTRFGFLHRNKNKSTLSKASVDFTETMSRKVKREIDELSVRKGYEGENDVISFGGGHKKR